MSGLPVIIVDSGGWPVTISESTPGGMSMTVSDSGYGFPVTVVESGGFPVSGISVGPTIAITSTSVFEDAAIGTAVGTLSVTGGSGTYTYTITEDPDTKFQIGGVSSNELQTAALLDYDTATTHVVTINADNGVDDPVEQDFTITVTDVGEIDGLSDFAWASTANDNIPDFSFDLPVGAAAGDVIRVRYGPSTTYFTHTLTAANITDDTFTVLGISALADGEYEFYARREVGLQTSAWTTPAVDVTINPAPVLASVDPLDPADAEGGVATTTNLTVTFDKAVQFGSGTIAIYKTDDTLFESFDAIADAGVELVIASNVLTINPAGTLAGGTGYYVQIAATAIENLAGLPFAGITNETDWTFTTISAANELRVEAYIADGTWTAPANIVGPIIIKGEVLAPGGASATNLGSGGGGAYSRCVNTTVVASRNYTVQVGVPAVATNGEDSFIQDSVSLSYLALAQGGRAHASGNAGGAAASGTGDVKWSGGNGNAGSAVQAGGTSAGDGGPDAQSGNGNSGGSLLGGVRIGASGALNTGGHNWGGGGRSTGSASGQGGSGYVRIHYQVPATAGYPYSVGREHGRDPTTGVSRFVRMPAGIEAGDVIIVACGTTTASSRTFTITGFTSFSTRTSSTNVSTALLYKIAAGTESSTDVTLTADLTCISTWVVNVIRDGGVPTATPTDGASTTPNPITHTPAAGSGAYLWLAFTLIDNNPNVHAPSSHFAGWTNHYIQPAGTGGTHIQMAELRATAASQDPPSHTIWSSDGWCAYTVSVPYSP